MALSFSYDEERDVLTVEGIQYSGALFRALGVQGLTKGSVLQILGREDGLLTVKDLGRTFVEIKAI